MRNERLRVVRGPESSGPKTSNAPHTVTVRLAEIVPLLEDAIAEQRMWLNDFQDDPVTIPADLHDVLQAYRSFRHDAA